MSAVRIEAGHIGAPKAIEIQNQCDRLVDPGGGDDGGVIALEQTESLANGNLLLVERRMVGAGNFVREVIVPDDEDNRAEPVTLDQLGKRKDGDFAWKSEESRKSVNICTVFRQ